MSFLQSISLLPPPFLIHTPTHINLTFFPNAPLRIRKISLPIHKCCSSPRSFPLTEQEFLQAVVESDERSLPSVRTYENDLARLTLVGPVNFEQALTAAAADGGRAADEHINSAMQAMVVETVFPGSVDEHSTVSTRLFLPARKVKEKASRLRRSLPEDMLSNTSSRNILAMTFRQVVLPLIWSFELVLFRPGTERNMEDLANPREVPGYFTLSSLDERIISLLAEAVCKSALQSTESHFLDNHIFRWFKKSQRITSKDSSVVIYKLFDDEIVENAKSLLDSFSSREEKIKPVKLKSKYYWWMPSANSKLEKIGGPKFSAWVSECVPAYRLQIFIDRFKDLKLDGGRRSTENIWEVLLTHSQMVGLADILDTYFEDVYSLPNKQLLCDVDLNFANLSTEKRNSSLLKTVSAMLASGILLITISALGQLCLPHIRKGGSKSIDYGSPPTSEIDTGMHRSLDVVKMESFCISIIKKIKDAFGWPDDILIEGSIGAWTGKVPDYLKTVRKAESDNGRARISPASVDKIGEGMEVSVQDIASYQVVLSTDGKIVGFQPTSQVAVNHWASNPLAKELYNGRKLSPGFIEPRLEIHRPDEVIVLELLISVNPEASFALARPA